jgi:hypothetical protein
MTMKKNGPASMTLKKNSQARVKAHVNSLARSSSSNLRILLYGLQAMRNGDFSVRLPGDWTGLEGKIADTFNEIVAANQKMAQELKRVGQVVGKEGKTRERISSDQSKGPGARWKSRSTRLLTTCSVRPLKSLAPSLPSPRGT